MQKIQEKLKKALESKMLVKFLYGTGIVIVAMLIFSLGVVVGFHKASFGRDWGEHYNENFGMERHSGRMGIGLMGHFPNSHGAIGKIIKIELPTLIVQGKDNTEKVILTKEDTKLQKIREEIKVSDLKVDDFIIIIGSPNAQGQIEAKFIRVLPNPELLK